MSTDRFKEDLSAVASALDSLLRDAQSRGAYSGGTASQGRENPSGDSGSARVGSVLKALEKLDERVKGLSDRRGQTNTYTADRRHPDMARSHPSPDNAISAAAPSNGTRHPARGDSADTPALRDALAQIAQRRAELDREPPGEDHPATRTDRPVRESGQGAAQRAGADDPAFWGGLDTRGPSHEPEPGPDTAPHHAPAPEGMVPQDVEKHFEALAARIDGFRAPQEKAIAELKRDIGALRHEVADTRQAVPATDPEDITRLNAAVEELRRSQIEKGQVDAVRGEIHSLREMIQDSNQAGMVQSLERGYSHIVQRLDELSRATDNPSLLNDLAARLGDIETAFATLPSLEHMGALDNRIANLARRIEEIPPHIHPADFDRLQSDVAGVRAAVEALTAGDLVEAIDLKMQAMSRRLDSVQQSAGNADGLEQRLDEIRSNMPSPATFAEIEQRMHDICGMLASDGSDAKLGQMAGQLAEVLSRLDRIEKNAAKANQDAALELIERRIAEVGSKLDGLDTALSDERERGTHALEQAVARLENNTGNADIGGRDLTDLETRIELLTARLADGNGQEIGRDISELRSEISAMRADVMAPLSATAELEKQIRHLAQMLSNPDRLSADGAVLGEVENKIAGLTEQIAAAEKRIEGIDEIESAIDRISARLEGNERNAIEAAQATVREAMREEQAAGPVDPIVLGLQDDLARLREAAETDKVDTASSLDSVQQTIGSIMSRLSQLEEPSAADKNRQAPGGPPPLDLSGEQVSTFTRAAPPDESEESEQPAAAAVMDLDNDRPLEPGTKRLARTMAPSKDNSRKETGSARDPKADFIAAARRAAQAASAEVAVQEEENRRKQQERREKSGLNWLRNKLGQGDAAGDASKPKNYRNGKRQDPKLDPAPEKRSKQPEEETAEKGGQAPGKPDDELVLSETDIVTPDGQNKGARAFTTSTPPSSNLTKAGAFVNRNRKPLVLAAAAVVLAIGALQIYKFVAAPSETGMQLTQQEVSRPAGDATASAGGGAQPGPIETVRSIETATPEVYAASEASTPSAIAPPSAGSDADSELTFAAPAVPPSRFAPSDTVQTDANGGLGSFSHDPALAVPGTTIVPNDGGGADGNPLREEVGSLALRTAAVGGDPAAQFEVAVRLTEGRGVTPNLEQAAKWYERAANQGLAPAQYRLASLYEKGRGVEKDVGLAQAWYQKAARQGNVKAMHNLAVLYAEGAAGEPKFDQAAQWFKKAASHGVRDSQYNLGILYARGLSVERDLEESYKWFALAAKQGDRDAGSKRDEIANAMTADMLTRAQLAVDSWKAVTLDDAVNTVPVDPAWVDDEERTAGANAAEQNDVADGRLVQQAQVLLSELGYDPGPADGVSGPKTRDAIRSFQETIGMPSDGRINAELVKELSSRSI